MKVEMHGRKVKDIRKRCTLMPRQNRKRTGLIGETLIRVLYNLNSNHLLPVIRNASSCWTPFQSIEHGSRGVTLVTVATEIPAFQFARRCYAAIHRLQSVRLDLGLFVP